MKQKYYWKKEYRPQMSPVKPDFLTKAISRIILTSLSESVPVRITEFFPA